MGARSVSFIFAALTLLASARAELQLSPREAEYELDGVKFRRLVFSDGSPTEITYRPPTGWTYTGSPAKFTLLPPQKAQAQATVTRVLLPEPAVFDEESLKKLGEVEIASLPSGSTNITLLSQEKNPVFIGRKETILVTLSYSFGGENFGRSVLVLNRGNEQIRFQLVSRLDDFKPLQQEFLTSLFGWRNL